MHARRSPGGPMAACLILLLSGAAAVEGLPEIHALRGVRIIVAPGHEITSGTVVMRDGIIAAAGADVEAPAGARLWDGAGRTVYAGLIEPYAVRPWPEAGPAGAADAASQGRHPNLAVTPERDMTSHAVDAGHFARLRAAGFTTAVIAPREGIFRGTSVFLSLGDGGLDANLLMRDVAQNITLRTHPEGDYPKSLMGAVALVRQTFADARGYAAAQAAYAERPAQRRPPFDLALAALVNAAAGRAPVVFETADVLDTLRAARLAAELGLDAVLVGNGQEYRRLDAVVAAGLPLLLPVAFPEPPEVGAEGDALDVDLEVLRHWKLAPENPGRLLAAGAEVAFTSHGLSDPKKIHGELATAIDRGLDRDAALAGLTTVPAALLGLGDHLGTVEEGKFADLVVVEGELFVDEPKIREVWIDGRRYELEEAEAAADEKAEVVP